MNWYKISQLVMKDIKDLKEDGYGRGRGSYLDIGHRKYQPSGKKKSTNYAWIYYNGTVLARKETADKNLHRLLFPEINFSEPFWSGRYESSTGRISIVGGHDRFREVPSIILTKLQNAFPDAIYLYRF